MDEAKSHFRLDCTSISYIKSVSAPFHAVDGHDDMDVSLGQQGYGGELSWLNLGINLVQTIPL